MLKSLKLYQPNFGNDELKAVKEVLESGILTQGPKVLELEKKFAKYVGSKYAVAVNSCTSAIFLCLLYEKMVIGIKKAVIPSITFVSVANAVINSGMKLDFRDQIYVGRSYYLTGTSIIDSAHYLKRYCYLENSLMCFSFYPTKLLASAEGGMIATDDKNIADWLRKMRANGMERKGLFDWDYTVELVGWKMVMTDLQAAIALVRLEKLEALNEKRQKIVDFYNKELKLKNDSLHVYPLLVDNRNQFIEKMRDKRITCSVHFKPIHLQPAYIAYNKKSLPKSEEWGKREVSIPLHENLSLEDAKRIVKEVKNYGIGLKTH